MWVDTSGIDFRRLRCFITVAEELHFGRAAQRLDLSTSAVSKHVRLLEHQLGVELLERTSRRVRLTEFGLLMLDHARAVLAEVETMRLLARNSSRSPTGRLSVGYRATAGDLMVQLNRAFRIAEPGIELFPTCLTAAEIDGAVQSGHLDVGLSSLGSATSLDESRVFGVKILSRRHFDTLVTPVEHRLLKLGRPPTVADLDGEVVVMSERGTHPELLDGFAEFFRVHNIHPILREYPAKSPAELIDLVASGFGVMIAVNDAFSYPAERALVSRLRLEGPKATYFDVIIWRKDNTSSLVQEFVELASNICVGSEPKDGEGGGVRMIVESGRS